MRELKSSVPFPQAQPMVHRTPIVPTEAEIREKTYEITGWSREQKISILCIAFIGAVATLNLFSSKIVGWYGSDGVSLMIFGIVVEFSMGGYLYFITFPCTDLVSRLVGKRRARRLVFQGFALNCAVVLFTWFAVAHPSASWWTNQEAYALVLGSTPRLVLAGMVSYLVSQQLDIFFFHKLLQSKIAGKSFAAQALGSTTMSQLIDSLIFVPTAFLGIGAFTLDVKGVLLVFGVSLSTWLVKILLTVCIMPILFLLKNWIGFSNEEGLPDEDYAESLLISGEYKPKFLTAE